MTPGTHDAQKVMTELNEQPRHHVVGAPQAGVRMLARITSVGFNVVGVTVGTEQQESAAFTVVKPTKVCPALDQDVDGYTYDYSGDLTEGQSRTSTTGQDVENQVVVPKFIVGDVVEIGPAPSNLGDLAASLASFKLQVVNSPAYWSKGAVS